MSSLHVKWRPKRFQDIVGQEKVVKVLRRSVIEGKVAQAYLFSGPRGVGKTTTARILAKALNCENPIDGEPCGRCQMCQDIDKGRLPDVVELDAASHTGIDDIRELIQAAKYPPSRARKKVFIVDEVHMLSTKAFNALLKTLEEPPSHVVFVLATTEPEKVPPTVRSRCQHFHFQLLPVHVVAEHLMKVAFTEGIDIEEPASFMIAMASGGSLRDALVMLEQAWLFSSGEKITERMVEESLSLSSVQVYVDFLRKVAEGDYRGAVEFVSRLSSSGKNPLQFVRDLIVYLREALSYRLKESLNESGQSSSLGASFRKDWFYDLLAESIKEFSIRDIMRMLEYAFIWEKDVRYSPYPAISLEVGAYRFTLSAHVPTIEEIVSVGPFAIDTLSERVAEKIYRKAEDIPGHGLPGEPAQVKRNFENQGDIGKGGKEPKSSESVHQDESAHLKEPEAEGKVETGEAEESATSELTPEDVKTKLKIYFKGQGILTLRAAIMASDISVEGDNIVISFSGIGAKGAVEKHRASLEKAVKVLFGKNLILRYEGEEKASKLLDSPTVDKIISLFDGSIVKVKESSDKGSSRESKSG